MARDKARIKAIEDLLGNLILASGGFPAWTGDPEGQADAVRNWLLAANDPRSTDAELEAAAKMVRK